LKVPGSRGSGTRGFSIENVYEHYHPQVFRFFVGKGLQHDAAEDLSQEVFYRVLRSEKPLVGEDYTRNLVFCIAQNLLIDYFRKNNGPVQERTATEDDVAATDNLALSCDASPEDVFISGETSEDVQKVLSGLPPRHAQAIMLRELEGLSYREMAERLGLSEKAAESLLHRARVQLKSGLAEAGEQRGGWWSTIPVAVSSLPRAVARRAASVPRWIATRAAGLSAGASSLAVGHSLLTLVVVILLVASAVTVGVVTATANRNHQGAAVSTGTQRDSVPRAEQGANVAAAVGIDALKTSPKPSDGPSQGQPASEVPGPAAVLGQTTGLARGLLQDVGGILDLVTSELSGILRATTEPLFHILGSIGLPDGMLDAVQQATGLALATDVEGALFDTGMQGTYLVDNTLQPRAQVAGAPASAPAAAATPGAVTSDSPASQQSPSGPVTKGTEANPTSTPTASQPPPEVQPTQPKPKTSPDGGLTDTVIDFVRGILP
jgi:RNA polymerase sigma-70 factor (ECF subfamily)